MRVWIIADNITSPLGFTTEQNLVSVLDGRSGIANYDKLWGIPAMVCASLFSPLQWESILQEGLTRFESLAYCSIREALSRVPGSINILDGRTIMLLSTTKADVENIEQSDYYEHMPAEAAQRIAHRLGLKNPPIVVCNACISGVSAQVVAMRLLATGSYDHAIVVGCDVQSRFVVSGFHSLKALSPEQCRPFDIERMGLNLGEAASTLVLSSCELGDSEWQLLEGAVCNDAIHITTPCPQGSGCTMAIEKVLDNDARHSLSLISLHGTATMYNDQMEAKAIQRSGLLETPVCALKGYFGHTMGAAGVLESILILHAMDKSVVPASLGFEEMGVSVPVRISNQICDLRGDQVLKIISGFGGCNGALLYSRMAGDVKVDETPFRIKHKVHITPHSVRLDDEDFTVEASGSQMLSSLYRSWVGNYPRFFKMDILCRLGFLATELLLQKEGDVSRQDVEQRAVVLFNHSSSIVADRAFQDSISGSDGFYPSPSVFVYTLPNIVAGELAIRNHYHGETSFYILDGKDGLRMQEVIRATFASRHIKSMLTGWVNAESVDDFEAEMSIVEKI